MESCSPSSSENPTHRERIKRKTATPGPAGTFEVVPGRERGLAHGDAVHRLRVRGVAVVRNHVVAGLGDFSPGVRSHRGHVQQEDGGAHSESRHRHLGKERKSAFWSGVTEAEQVSLGPQGGDSAEPPAPSNQLAKRSLPRVS